MKPFEGDDSHLKRVQPPARPVSDQSEDRANVVTQDHLHEKPRIDQSRPIKNLIILCGARGRISDWQG